MGCQKNNPDWIVAYSAGTLDAPTQAALELHLLECPECRELAGSQKAVWAALDHWPPAPISADFDEKLYARIAQQEQESWWRRLSHWDWSWRPAVPVAAACAALIAAFLLKPPAPIPVNQAHATHAPQKIQIEQVERALDDMDMLKQITSVPSPNSAPSPEKI
jgi:anti-sigma factor RsiW